MQYSGLRAATSQKPFWYRRKQSNLQFTNSRDLYLFLILFARQTQYNSKLGRIHRFLVGSFQETMTSTYLCIVIAAALICAFVGLGGLKILWRIKK
jgi:hypothetical protein